MVLGADESKGISVRGSFLRFLVVVGGGVGAAEEAGAVGRETLLAVTTLAISAKPEERKLSALE